jgi:hypothetical protein
MPKKYGRGNKKVWKLTEADARKPWRDPKSKVARFKAAVRGSTVRKENTDIMASAMRTKKVISKAIPEGTGMTKPYRKKRAKKK